MVVVRLTTDALSAWAPNIATSAATVALTITVVERLLRSEGERRRRPRTERVLYWMGLDFRGLTSAIVLDYVSAHTHPQQVPADALELIDLWISEQDAEDRPRRPLDGEWLPMLLLEAQDFASQLSVTAHAISTCWPTISFVRSTTAAGWSAKPSSSLDSPRAEPRPTRTGRYASP